MARGRGGGMGIPRERALYEPPASLRSASPFCSAKRGGIAAGHPPFDGVACAVSRPCCRSLGLCERGGGLGL